MLKIMPITLPGSKDLHRKKYLIMSWDGGAHYSRSQKI
jgi:hypothetical protein